MVRPPLRRGWLTPLQLGCGQPTMARPSEKESPWTLSPATVERVRSELRESRADEGAREDVARIVNAGMHAGVRDRGCERAKPHGGSRQCVSHTGGESE